MTPMVRSIRALVLLAVAFSTPLVAQELSDVIRVSREGLTYNARALGMGNAYSTIGYDFSALTFNPATMAESDRPSYTMSLNANEFRANSNYFGSTTPFSTGSTTPNQVGFTFPIRSDTERATVIGIGYTQSKDFNLGYQYDGINGGSPSFIQRLAGISDPVMRTLGLSYATYDSSGRYLGDHSILGPGMNENGYLLDDGGLYHVSAGISVEAVPNVFFGVSGSYITGTYTSDLQLSATDVNNVYPVGVQTDPANPATDGFLSASYRATTKKTYRGWETRFGVMYRLENFIGLSASFHVPFGTTVDQDLYVGGISQFAGDRSITVPQTRTSSSYTFKPPVETTVGGMVNLWIITGTAELSYIDYSQTRITDNSGDLPDRTLMNKTIVDKLTPVVNMHAGVEFRLPFTGLSARVGGIYLPSPYGGDPARFSQKFLTAGFGINSNEMMQVDLGYAYGWRGEHIDQQTDLPTGSEQQTTYHSVLISMRFMP